MPQPPEFPDKPEPLLACLLAIGQLFGMTDENQLQRIWAETTDADEWTKVRIVARQLRWRVDQLTPAPGAP